MELTSRFSSLTFNSMPRIIRRKSALKSTRVGIVDQLKVIGPSDSRRLGSRLGISAMAVRQHLYALRRQRLVTYRIEQRPFGRPAKVWRLAAAADKFFPDCHSDLCVGLLDSIRAAFGQKGLDRLINVQTERQAELLVSRMARNAPISDRLTALVNVRSEQGYIAELQVMGTDMFLVIENHCPIRSAAEACPALCEAELESFRTVLGRDILVERREHVLGGDRRCTYLVQKQRETS